MVGIYNICTFYIYMYVEVTLVGVLKGLNADVYGWDTANF